MRTTTQVAKLLEMSLEQFKVFRGGLNIEGKLHICKNKARAYLFSDDQVKILVQEQEQRKKRDQVSREKRNQVKEEGRKLLKQRLETRNRQRRNNLLRVLPEYTP